MIAKADYTQASYTLPLNIVKMVDNYASTTHQKPSQIVAEAIADYINKTTRISSAKEAKKMFGLFHGDTPDIQEIKANRDDV